MKKSIKILTIVGARPQFIKAAVVSRAVASHNRSNPETAVHEDICHTGQHYDHGMSQVFFDEMGIPEPYINLGVGSGLHGQTTAAMLAGIEQEIVARKPDAVLVYGDTNSTLAGALSAAKLNVPLAHVEAGLRSFNRRMPEEINRVVTDHVARLLFCPCSNAQEQLRREGVETGVHVVGDVMYDALLYYRSGAVSPAISEPFALATIHRAENTDDPVRLENIITALDACPVKVVLPTHPRTREAVKRGAIKPRGSLELIDPVSYREMLGYLQECRFVITDSGGLQKEAYFSEKPCITVRDETEWVELASAGANRVVGAGKDRILSAFDWAMAKSGSFSHNRIYGDGHSGEKILEILMQTLDRQP